MLHSEWRGWVMGTKCKFFSGLNKIIKHWFAVTEIAYFCWVELKIMDKKLRADKVSQNYFLICSTLRIMTISQCLTWTLNNPITFHLILSPSHGFSLFHGKQIFFLVIVNVYSESWSGWNLLIQQRQGWKWTFCHCLSQLNKCQKTLCWYIYCGNTYWMQNGLNWVRQLFSMNVVMLDTKCYHNIYPCD